MAAECRGQMELFDTDGHIPRRAYVAFVCPDCDGDRGDEVGHFGSRLSVPDCECGSRRAPWEVTWWA